MAEDAVYGAVFLRMHPTGKAVLSLSEASRGKEAKLAGIAAAELGIPPEAKVLLFVANAGRRNYWKDLEQPNIFKRWMPIPGQLKQMSPRSCASNYWKCLCSITSTSFLCKAKTKVLKKHSGI